MAVIKCKGTGIVGHPVIRHLRVCFSVSVHCWMATGELVNSAYSELSPVDAVRRLLKGTCPARLFMEVEQAFGYVPQEATWDGEAVTLVEPVRIAE